MSGRGEFLVVSKFWSCQNSGRVEILVVVALVWASKNGDNGM